MRLLMIRGSRYIKSIWYQVCVFYARLRLKWGFKGNPETFDNYLKFHQTDYPARFMWTEDFNPTALLEAKRLSSEPYDEYHTVKLMDKKDKKSVRQSIKDSILEVRNSDKEYIPNEWL
jgi:hypothetical protein